MCLSVDTVTGKEGEPGGVKGKKKKKKKRGGRVGDKKERGQSIAQSSIASRPIGGDGNRDGRLSPQTHKVSG